MLTAVENSSAGTISLGRRSLADGSREHLWEFSRLRKIRLGPDDHAAVQCSRRTRRCTGLGRPVWVVPSSPAAGRRTSRSWLRQPSHQAEPSIAGYQTGHRLLRHRSRQQPWKDSMGRRLGSSQTRWWWAAAPRQHAEPEPGNGSSLRSCWISTSESGATLQTVAPRIRYVEKRAATGGRSLPCGTGLAASRFFLTASPGRARPRAGPPCGPAPPRPRRMAACIRACSHGHPARPHPAPPVARDLHPSAE